MLVLSRKIGEKILIGKDIIVTVLEIRGTRAKLGIAAPEDRRVLRGELYVNWEAPANRETEKQVSMLAASL